MEIKFKDMILPRIIKRSKKDIGVSPDELIFRGSHQQEDVHLKIIDFDSKTLNENTIESIESIKSYQNQQTVTWLNVDGLHKTKLMEDLAIAFNLDKLVLAEVMNTDARPRIVDFDNCTLITIKMLQQEEGSNLITVENLSLILTKEVLISFQEKNGDVFEPVRDRIRKKKKRIRNGGTDYLTFALLDIVIDNYLHTISLLGENIEKLEENLLTNPNQQIIKEINRYKRELNFLRKNIKPAKEMIFSLAKLESDFISESSSVHFKELQDNISQASDASDSYREILSDQLNIYHTTLSSKLNDIMKFLTVFSVVFIPLTFIAGIYGTNFDNVPELHYKYSYFIMWGLMIVVAILMLLYFKKKKWL